MQHREISFDGMDGIQLYSQYWLPEGSPRAILAIVHGIGEHSGRYMNIVNHVVPNQFAVYGYDHRGHGKSPGQRGHIDSWVDYRIDLRNFLMMIKSQHSRCSIFLLGHSMGALIVLDFIIAEREELAGAILSGTPIEPAAVAKPHRVVIARLLSRIFPRFPIDLRIDCNALSRIPAAVKACEEDPLMHRRVSTRWGTEALSALERVKKGGGNIDIPILMIHGEADRVNLAIGAKKFFDQIQYNDKEYISYPACYHEVHNDLDYEEMLTDLVDWINRHIEDQ